MQKCQFIADSQDVRKKICSVCGRVVLSTKDVEKLTANCNTFRGNRTLNIRLELPKKEKQKVEVSAPKAEPVKLPSLVDMGLNLLGSIKDFASNPKFLSKEDYQKRLEICAECPFKIPNKNRCLKCGCSLAAKALAEAFHCPEKKWPGD